jgi:hypothetical protein
MAQQVALTVYKRNQYDLSNANGTPATSGLSYSFAVNSFIARPVEEATTANGVSMNSVIEVLPTGLNQPSVYFFTTSTVAQINTAANA